MSDSLLQYTPTHVEFTVTIYTNTVMSDSLSHYTQTHVGFTVTIYTHSHVGFTVTIYTNTAMSDSLSQYTQTQSCRIHCHNTHKHMSDPLLQYTHCLIHCHNTMSDSLSQYTHCLIHCHNTHKHMSDLLLQYKVSRVLEPIKMLYIRLLPVIRTMVRLSPRLFILFYFFMWLDDLFPPSMTFTVDLALIITITFFFLNTQEGFLLPCTRPFPFRQLHSIFGDTEGTEAWLQDAAEYSLTTTRRREPSDSIPGLLRLNPASYTHWATSSPTRQWYTPKTRSTPTGFPTTEAAKRTALISEQWRGHGFRLYGWYFREKSRARMRETMVVQRN